jgi:hypothetical protein
MRAKLYAGLLATAALAAIAGVAHASPVAMASNMVGKPVYRSGGGAWKPLGVLQRLSPGDEVKCAPGQQAVIMMFTDGVRFKVASGKTGTVEPTSVRGAQPVGGAGGATIRVAKAMTGLDTQPFLARPGHSFERLETSSPGIVIVGTPSVTWAVTDPGTATYVLTLFNQNNNVVWSTRTSGPTADLPTDVALVTRRPYVWTIAEYSKSGKPYPGTRWGIVTFLSSDDAAQLNSDAKSLNDQFSANPTDFTPKLLLAELYRSYGVYNGTLEALQDAMPSGQPGITKAMEDAIAQVSPYAVFLHRLDAGAKPATD